MQITIQVRGTKATIENLKRVSSQISDFREEMTEIGHMLADFYASVPFISRGGIYGENWKPLSPKYAVRKARLYPGRPLLEATGTMANSFRFQSGATFSRIYNTASYFKYHQSSAPRRKIPRRMMMALTDQHVATIKQIIEDGLRRRLG